MAEPLHRVTATKVVSGTPSEEFACCPKKRLWHSSMTARLMP